jgi:predicted RNase H-like nuclease (RuvC/YqgF family)
MDFVTAINEKQKEISALERQTATISGKLAEADRIKEQVEYFEKAIEKLDAEMKNIGAGMKNVEKVAKDFDGYGTKMAEFEKKIAAVAVKTKIIDKLKKDLNQASLMADELKARQNGLKEEKDLIDKAITAAAKLEELVYRAEHIKEKAK